MVLSRATQTNEAGRCATLLPSLAAIAAAEGVRWRCLRWAPRLAWPCIPDRYRYEYDDGTTVTRLVSGI